MNLPPALQFSDNDTEDGEQSPTVAHMIAKALLRNRYLGAKFHIGRPFLYKALHAPLYTSESEYDEIRQGLRGAMYWPLFMGLCSQLRSALPMKFGFSSHCFGQILLFHAVARSENPKLRETLPVGWREWVQNLTSLLESYEDSSPGLAKDVELIRLL